MNKPTLSVVVASDRAGGRLLECVAALLAQGGPDPMQIIVADCSGDGLVGEIGNPTGAVEVVRFSQRVPWPTLLAAGLQRARGDFVAILEARCVPQIGWAGALRHALRQSNTVVGGVVEFEGRAKLVDWAAYFCDYGQFMRPWPTGTVRELPGNNCAFPRVLLEKYPEYTQPGFWKTFFLWQVQEREGVRLLAVPAMAVGYRREFRSSFEFLARRFHHARCFGAMRRARLSSTQRRRYTLLAPLLPPLLPPLLLWRTFRKVWPKARYRLRLIRSLPLIGLAGVVWTAGEWLGHMVGPGSSCQKVK
ncbi:MAG: glycosyltransferase [Acidobacteria bacterium]|nr:glycosyltransferase [Acidobacteriota bacterium]